MYSSDKNINNIMISLNHDFAIFISKWFYKNFMVLNPDKCSFMLLYFLLTLNLLSNNVTIKNNKDEKVLGIKFDDKLYFSTYLTSITKKVNIELNDLTRVQNFITSGQKTFLTSSFIKSQFNYCLLIWIFCSKQALHRLDNKHSLCALHTKIMAHTLVQV